MMNNSISILDIIDGTVVDGPGFRISIYGAGCEHKCVGCHNPQSWSISNGKLMGIGDLFNIIKESPWNVTFSGGDPFFQVEQFTALAKLIKANTSKNIWCYTGYLYEEILACPLKSQLLNYIDVLVDGKFDKSLSDETLQFRGSSNQRIIEAK